MTICASEVFFSGSTIRLLCSIRDYNGNLVDPDIIKLIIYNYKGEEIENVVISDGSKISTGSYEYFYKTDSSIRDTKLIYEWNIEFQGSIAIDRDEIRVQFLGGRGR